MVLIYVAVRCCHCWFFAYSSRKCTFTLGTICGALTSHVLEHLVGRNVVVTLEPDRGDHADSADHQGGMGVAVSNWQLANAVSKLGQLGVVSGTALDSVLVRRLQDGDPGGYVRRALESFPFEALSARALKLFFLPGGRAAGAPYKRVPMPSSVTHPEHGWLSVLGGFVEVHLARAGHSGMVGINLLTKIQMTTLPTLYGALLAGVHVVLMGAGIPRDIPDALTRLTSGQVATLKLEVTGSKEAVPLEFDPFALMGVRLELSRPAFLPIVSSNVLATMLARRGADAVQGFVVE
ncbi:MAG: hypothetical protein HC933_20940, partial [Pleurocapsa sp. SU_196_0]|nr:hypothetical protein [Pleurocapsa sp. SU_196_0]